MIRDYDTKWTDLTPAEVLPNLYLGSYYDIYNLTHSVRVSVLDNESFYSIESGQDAETIETRKLKINARDDCTTNIMSHFNTVRDFLDSQPEDSIKFIHCVAGMNRSAALATAYYMYKTKRPLLQALQYMIALRPVILRNESFLQQLVIWAYDNDLVEPISEY
jgi:predicted protein tyrosine phosphatase